MLCIVWSAMTKLIVVDAIVFFDLQSAVFICSFYGSDTSKNLVSVCCWFVSTSGRITSLKVAARPILGSVEVFSIRRSPVFMGTAPEQKRGLSKPNLGLRLGQWHFFYFMLPGTWTVSVRPAVYTNESIYLQFRVQKSIIQSCGWFFLHFSEGR